MKTENRTDWCVMTKEVLALIVRLRQKPKKIGYQLSPGGILNAYREGDITFTEAITALERWARMNPVLDRIGMPKL